LNNAVLPLLGVPTRTTRVTLVSLFDRHPAWFGKMTRIAIA
jgi:hypothetical protein